MPNYLTLQINRFLGIHALTPKVDVVNAGVMSALEAKNVELKFSRNGDNVGIYTVDGNVEIAALPGKTIRGAWESVLGGLRYCFVYAVDGSGGYLYQYKAATGEFVPLKNGLAATACCNGRTVAQGYYDYFVFTNGVDDYLAVNPAAELEDDRVKPLGAKDAENRDIRGLALDFYDGRLVTACQNRIHWSQTGNIFEWAANTTGVYTNPAYQELDREVKALVYYNNTLVAFTDSYSVCYSGNPGNPAAFSKSGATGGGCAGFNAAIRFDNKLYYYDHFARNVFAYYLYDNGQTRPTNGLANEVKVCFDKIDPERLDELQMAGFTLEERSEIWFKLPKKGGGTLVLIWDYLKNEWLERDQPEVASMLMWDNLICTTGGSKIRQEYLGNTFDGEFRPAEYLMNIINVGSDSNLKIPKLPIIFTFDSRYSNNFYIELTYDDKPERKKLKKIEKNNDKYLVWAYQEDDETGGYWALDEQDEAGGLWARDDSLNVTYSLAGTLPFKQLQLRIFTQEVNQGFGIKRIEMKKVKVKTKTVM